MSETPTPMGKRSGPNLSQVALDAAWGRFRKALVDLLHEGLRSPDVLPAMGPIVKEATAALNRLAKEARKATAASKRKQELRGRQEAQLKRSLRKLEGAGSPAAARMLGKLDGGSPDDAA